MLASTAATAPPNPPPPTSPTSNAATTPLSPFPTSDFFCQEGKCLDPCDHSLYKFGKLHRARQVLSSLLSGNELKHEHP